MVNQNSIVLYVNKNKHLIYLQLMLLVWFVITIHSAARFYTELIIHAAYNDDQEKIVQLIKQGADINIANVGGYTALLHSAIKGNKEIVELLLHAGADIEHKNNSGETAIDYAIIKNKLAIVKMLKDEPSRRAEVIKKWIKENLGRIINESTQGILIPDIANIITEYTTIEYIDLPLIDRLGLETNKEKIEEVNIKVTKKKCVIS